MKLRRDVASIPARSAKETWKVIIDLVTEADTVDREHLHAAASIMESIVADELPGEVPFVFKGSGTRVVVYCLYGEDAMDADLETDPLPTNPTSGDWRATAPSEAEDVKWMNGALRSRAPRISVHDVDSAPEDEKATDVGRTGVTFNIGLSSTSGG